MCYKGKKKKLFVYIQLKNVYIYLFLFACSVCLPTVLIPIIKLSTSSNILSKEFRPSKLLQFICWLLTLVVISFDIYLFVKHATDILTSVLIGVTGTIYIVFLIYLVWKPLQETDKPADGWMSLPQHEQTTSDDEEIYAL